MPLSFHTPDSSIQSPLAIVPTQCTTLRATLLTTDLATGLTVIYRLPRLLFVLNLFTLRFCFTRLPALSFANLARMVNPRFATTALLQ